MHKRILVLAVVLVVFGAGALEAQELRGRIVGAVRDNTGGVLPGVTATASGPALIQPQTTVSGSDGSYVFPALPPGVYDVVFELGGFQTVRHEGVRVNLNVTLTINVDMAIAGVEETITITGESPVVDVKTTTTGTNFTDELLNDIPNARDIWASMSQAPGFQMEGYDVGGSHAGTQTGYQAFGFGDQHRTLLEGINVTETTAGNAGYFDYGSFEEFQIGGSGNMGETHGLGAFLNVTVKSGGDRFSGNAYGDLVTSGLVSDNVPDELRQAGGEKDGFFAPNREGGVLAGNPVETQWDANVGVGGPIVKGKAWFFGSYRKNKQERLTAGSVVPAITELVNYSIKGTYQINSSNTFIGFFNRRTKLQAERNLSAAVPLEAAWYQNSENIPYKLEWTSVVNDNAFLDVQFANWINKFPLFPTGTQSQSTEGVSPGRLDLDTDQFTGAASYYHLRDVRKPQLQASMSYYKDDWNGTHSFKFGTEIYREKRQFDRFQPGDVFYYDRSGVPSELELYNTPNAGINTVSLFNLYAQDSWTLNDRVTLNLGVRLDRYAMGWPSQSIDPGLPDVFPPLDVESRDVATFTNLAPRVGVAYDLTGEGRTVVKAFYGRFYWNPSTTIVDDENPVGVVRRRHEFNDLNGNGILDPGPDGGLGSSPELGTLLNTFGGAGSVTVDPDIENAHGNELSVHVEHELQNNFSLRGSYVYKNSRNMYGVVDTNRAFAYTIPFTFNDPGADNTPGTGDDQVLQLLDRDPSVPENRIYTNPGRAAGTCRTSKPDYNTVEVRASTSASRTSVDVLDVVPTHVGERLQPNDRVDECASPLRGSTSKKARTTSGRRIRRFGSVRRTRRTGTTKWSDGTCSRTTSVFPRAISFKADSTSRGASVFGCRTLAASA